MYDFTGEEVLQNIIKNSFRRTDEMYVKLAVYIPMKY